MSSTPPAAPDPHYGDNHDGTGASPGSQLLSPGNQAASPTTTSMTRTVAIIKTHALHHRFEIEKRIQEASFEIVKERQMEFDTETDPETLDELFGEDAASLAEGPVWVYVLERRRAVEVWNTLMGDRDPEVARQDTPRSLRALYGISYARNGLMGSPDNHTAEIQIASLFVSSPPFSSTELPPEDNHTVTLAELSSSVYAALAGQSSEHTYAASDITSPSTTAGGGGRMSSTHRTSSITSGGGGGSNKVPFKARPIPATIDKPDIVPRTTKAAALRAGIPLEKIQAASSGPRAPVPKERLAQTFANVPGHKRTTTIAVASTAAPTIAPRMTRAASLRIGQPVESSSSIKAPALKQRAVTDGERNKHGAVATFEGVPGHKRRESIAVASTKAPTVAPRLNKSAALRAQKDKEAKEAAKPPSSFKAPSKPGTGTLSRASSSGALNPATAPRPASQASTPKTRPSLAPTQPTTTGHTRASSVLGTSSATTKLKPRPSSSMGAAPSIAPRTNKSAALRAAKMEAEAAAAAEKAEKERLRKGGRAPPSSFKQIAV